MDTPNPPPSPPSSCEWTIQKIRDLVEKRFGKRPCWFQMKIAMALRAGKDVRKEKDKMVVVVTPLNLLGTQTQTQLNDAGLDCIAVSKLNNNPTTYKNIAAGKYRVVTISPELLNDQPCRDLFEDPKVAAKLLYFVFDEGHCVSQWGHNFRNKYLYVGNLRYLLGVSTKIPFYVASATLPPHILDDVSGLLRLRPDATEKVICSNDRPNIHLVVRPMEHAINTYRDLAFLIPDHFTTNMSPPPKFLVFFDSTTNAEDAVRYLRSRLPPELHDKIKWFHSTMTAAYREEEFQRFASGDVWGMAVTDAFGMGLDLPDVQIVVQYRIPGDLCTLWQRFGRAGRAAGSEATAILLVEKANLDVERTKRLASNEARREKRARGKESSHAPPSKRPALTSMTNDEHQTTIEDTDKDSDSDNEDNEDDTPLASNTSIEALAKRSNNARQSSYHYPSKSTNSATTKSRHVLEVGTPLDDFVNASTRNISCRRTVADLYFTHSNVPKTDRYHYECLPTMPNGCDRCSPKPSRLCCDLCNPDNFSSVAPVNVQKSTAATRRSHLKAYEPTNADRELKWKLKAWRNEQAENALGAASFNEWGPGLFMSDETLDQIVGCFHYGKLADLDSVRRETQWREDRITTYGPGLFNLIQGMLPLASPATPSLHRAPPTCGACGQKGHTKRSSTCPTRITRLAANPHIIHHNQENISPRISISASPSRGLLYSTYQTPTPARTLTQSTPSFSQHSSRSTPTTPFTPSNLRFT